MANTDEKAIYIDDAYLCGVSSQQSEIESDTPPKTASYEITSGADDTTGLQDTLKKIISELSISEGVPITLPPETLIAKVLSLPATDGESFTSMVRLTMEKFAPVTDDELEVAYEVIGATENETRVIAIATPISALNKLSEDIEQADLMITRLDATLLCEWHSFKASEEISKPAEGEYGVIFITQSGRYDLFIADQYGPLFVRSLGRPASKDELVRELTLSLLDSSTANNAPTPEKFIVITHDALSEETVESIKGTLQTDLEIHMESELKYSYAQSLLIREAGDGYIDLIPPVWRDEEKAAANKKRFKHSIIAALLLWVAYTLTIVFLPKLATTKVDAIDKEIDALTEQFREVSDIRSRVRLIRDYEDRSQSFLDTFKTVCESMPEGMIFTSVTYEKSGISPVNDKPIIGGYRIIGDSPTANSASYFKDALDSVGIFSASKTSDQKLDVKRNRYRFEIDARFSDTIGEERE